MMLPHLQNRLVVMLKKIALSSLVVALCTSVPAAIYQFNFNNGGTIPDNSPTGLTDQRNLSSQGMFPAEIRDLTLVLNLMGGADADLSGFLRLGNQQNAPAATFAMGTIHSGMTMDLTPTFGDKGYDPNNYWTLFLADGSYLGTDTLVSWTLTVTPVPEPVTFALGTFAALVAAGTVGSWLRRRTPVPQE